MKKRVTAIHHLHKRLHSQLMGIHVMKIKNASTNEKILTQTPPEHNYKILGVSFISGYMIPHAKEVLNVRGTNPRGYEANIFWHMYNNDVWNDCNCYPRIGAFISFYDF